MGTCCRQQASHWQSLGLPLDCRSERLLTAAGFTSALGCHFDS